MGGSGARDRRAIHEDLRRAVRGDVISTDTGPSEVGTDFGGLVRKTPAIVVRPQDANDVSQVISYAVAQTIPVTTRAAGHSQGGQSLSDGGILLDLRGLNVVQPVNTEDSRVLAGAGARWLQVTEQALHCGLVPPVLTNSFFATLGGTHSTGGIGTSSFRDGSQAANCLGLEVVTGEGEILRCSPAEQQDLFRHVLCGLGQFGVMTKVEHALRAHKRYVRTDTYVYDDLTGFLEDMLFLAEEGLVDYLNAFVVPHPTGRSWLFPLLLTSEIDDPEQRTPPRAPHASRHHRSQTSSFDDFILSPEDRLESPRGTATVRPWIDAFLSWPEAQTSIEDILRMMPRDLPCSYALRPFRPDRTRTPLLALPAGKTCLGFGVFPVVPSENAAHVLSLISDVSEHLTAGDGKRYLSGWNGFAAKDGRSHYGEYWDTARKAKHRYDPHGVLNPGVGVDAGF